MTMTTWRNPLGDYTTWRKLLIEKMADNRERFPDDVIDTTLSEEQLDTEFDSGFGGSEGCPFTLWTKNRVYFPVVYDGAEWVESVPRHPCDEAIKHVGGQ